MGNPSSSTTATRPHYTGIDLLRAIACCIVLTVHSCECYYISNLYAAPLDQIDMNVYHSEALWAGIIDSFCRICVPLFVMISGFLLLPMKPGMSMGQFYRKRALRVVIPLFIWTVIYAFYQAFKYDNGLVTTGDYVVYILKQIGYFFVNFPDPIGHLWYPYMCIGLYLLIPFISPWVEKATRGEFHVFLGIWGLTTLLPYIHLIWPAVWGECAWNPDNTVYHFSGFIGYLIMGAYCRKYLYESKRSFLGIGLLLTILGYAGSLYGYQYMLNTTSPDPADVYPYIVNLEFTWGFTQLTVVLNTIGIFLMLFRFQKQLPAIVTDFSRLSYGVYLCHIMFLTWCYETLICPLAWPTPCKIFTIAIFTIIVSYLLIKVLSYLPKSKYLVG